MSAGRIPYAGVATRGVAFAIDLVVVHGIFVVGAALVGLAASLVGSLRPEWLVGIIVGLGWALTVGIYFIGCWAITGQTPGMRVMRVRVLARDGAPPHAARAAIRLVGLILSIIPLFAGFIPVLIDDRRRGLADFMAGTVVVYADAELAVAAPESAASVIVSGPMRT